MSVSFLEVYNENIRDLLNDSEEFLDLREDPIKGNDGWCAFIEHEKKCIIMVLRDRENAWTLMTVSERYKRYC